MSSQLPVGLPSRIYPVVDSAAWVQRLVEHGARLIQLRVKSTDTARLRQQIRSARLACVAAGATLVVNDHWQLAIEEGASVIHLGQEDLDEADREAIRRSGARLGISTHSDEELERALVLAPDYVALGPVYPTTLKVMPWAPQGLDRIGEWRRRIGRLPLVAIGGITLERAAGCLEAGADCVAVVSDIVGHADPEARMSAWVRILDDQSQNAAGTWR
ncbi:thiamine phosphate synthase [Lichenicoccus roseus]|uniref:thiamine phosphate synthase n=1 Tax=Lichenicoccus roseus TaxID=2683649 RepID=UPI0026C17837